MKKNDFFHIHESALDEKTFFPFHLFIYNPSDKNYYPFIRANSPFDHEKKRLYKKVKRRGAILAISTRQRLTFERFAKKNTKGSSIIKEKYSPQKAALLIQEQAFETPKVIQESFNTGSFIELIERTRLEVLSFNANQSNTISLARDLADEFLIRDSILNRSIALSFQMIKLGESSSIELLSDLIVAGFLAQLGLTQINHIAIQTDFKNLSKTQFSVYKRYPAFSQLIVGKAQIIITERAHKIIYQHREKANGSGFAEGQVEAYIEPAALILHSCLDFFQKESAGEFNFNKMKEKIEVLYGKVFSDCFSSIFSCDLAKEEVA